MPTGLRSPHTGGGGGRSQSHLEHHGLMAGSALGPPPWLGINQASTIMNTVQCSVCTTLEYRLSCMCLCTVARW